MGGREDVVTYAGVDPNMYPAAPIHEPNNTSAQQTCKCKIWTCSSISQFDLKVARMQWTGVGDVHRHLVMV